MNKDNAKDYLPLVQALADGKTIQESLGTRWDDMTSAMFTRDPRDYRIKPEPCKPREFKLSLNKDGKIYDAGPNEMYRDPIEPIGGSIIRVREIIEE